MSADGNAARVEVKVHRTAVVLGTDDRPAIELTNVNGEVKVVLLPKNGGRRAPVAIDDLADAVRAIQAPRLTEKAG